MGAPHKGQMSLNMLKNQTKQNSLNFTSNIAHLEAFNDSINEMGFTRGKNGAIDLNSLLRSPKMLEDDGIEDMHFH